MLGTQVIYNSCMEIGYNEFFNLISIVSASNEEQNAQNSPATTCDCIEPPLSQLGHGKMGSCMVALWLPVYLTPLERKHVGISGVRQVMIT